MPDRVPDRVSFDDGVSPRLGDAATLQEAMLLLDVLIGVKPEIGDTARRCRNDLRVIVVRMLLEKTAPKG